MTPAILRRLCIESVKRWSDDYAQSMGAALAYYAMFSIAPLLLIVISVTGVFFGPEAIRGEIFSQLRGLMGDEGALAVQQLLESVSQPDKSLLATVIGAIMLAVGATTVFGELQDDLDRIWKSPPRRKEAGLWRLIQGRLLSFGMILGIGFLLLVSLIFNALLTAMGTWWAPIFGTWVKVAAVSNAVISFILVAVMFALIYKFMPRARVLWSDVLVGALVTAFLFTIGKALIGMYLGASGVASGYGTAGSLIALLVWVYYSAQIFLLGAEFTKVYAESHGSLK
ncbi:MAG TPA: YihY/virulence factor BrkB family protein [Methylophilaceae bacterium]|nr:YihY/virulence factor BrkB family protein [Methylophilaceae bacterium]